MTATTPQYDKSHGSPYDRGAADSYYDRLFDPHCYMYGSGSYNSPRVDMVDMSAEQITAYTKGYNTNEEEGHKKSAMLDA